MTERHQPTIFKEQRRSRTSSISIIGSTVGIFWDLGGKNTFDRALRRFFSDTRPPGRIWFSLYANLACRYKEASWGFYWVESAQVASTKKSVTVNLDQIWGMWVHADRLANTVSVGRACGKNLRSIGSTLGWIGSGFGGLSEIVGNFQLFSIACLFPCTSLLLILTTVRTQVSCKTYQDTLNSQKR